MANIAGVNTFQFCGATPASSPGVPPLKLCRRTQVKDKVSIAQTDPKFDTMLNSMIAQFSQQVEHWTGRKMLYKQYEEFHQAYDQDIRVESLNEDPQYIMPLAVPVDLTQPIDLRYSFSTDWDDSDPLTLNEDYFFDELFDTPNAVIRVFPLRLVTTQAFFPLISRGRTTVYNQVGFRLIYTGGFKVVTPGTDCIDNDETFLDVPLGLQDYVAMKVGLHFLDQKNNPLRITEDDEVILEPYKRHGNILGR